MDVNLYGLICYILGFLTCALFHLIRKRNGKTE